MDEPLRRFITDSVVDQVSAANGAFIFYSSALTVTDFTMTNTTLNMCEISADSGYVMNVKVTGDFVFDNNTIGNTTCRNAVTFVVTNTPLVFQDCLFESLDSSRFALVMTPSGDPIESLVIESAKSQQQICPTDFKPNLQAARKCLRVRTSAMHAVFVILQAKLFRDGDMFEGFRKLKAGTAVNIQNNVRGVVREGYRTHYVHHADVTAVMDQRVLIIRIDSIHLR